jgi:ATP-binding cassette, subfamily B, bacterial CvaB/MchF/RaxB
VAITRIIVAHRPETIASADRVIVLDGGIVVADRVRTPREAPADAGESTLEPASLDRGV